MPVARQAELRGGKVEGLVPADALPATGAAPQGMGDPLGIVLAVLEEAIDLAAEGAPGERVLGISADPDDAIAVDLCHHAAGIEAIERASRLDDPKHQRNSGAQRSRRRSARRIRVTRATPTAESTTTEANMSVEFSVASEVIIR